MTIWQSASLLMASDDININPFR